MKKKECKEKIESMEKELTKLKGELEDCCEEREFKIGDWVCFNHGEYPEYFSREVGQITHFSKQYCQKGTAQFGHCIGGGWDDDCIRHAHIDEIEYHKSGLPFVYNKDKGEYELITILGNGHFKIGSLLDSRNFTKEPKELLTLLLETGMLNALGEKYLSKIWEKISAKNGTMRYYKLIKKCPELSVINVGDRVSMVDECINQCKVVWTMVGTPTKEQLFDERYWEEIYE